MKKIKKISQSVATGNIVNASSSKADETYSCNFTNMIFNALPRVTGTGTSVTLNNTAKCPMDISLAGNITQTTLIGKNIFDKNAIIDNSAYSGNVGDTIVVTSNNFTFRTPILPVTSNFISISSSISTVNFRTFLLDENQKILANIWNGSMPQTIDLTGATYFALFFSKSYISVNDNIQIESGQTATDYEPYCGGIPSPNPNYPQDVHIVTGNNTITVGSTNYSVNLGSLTMCKIGDYKDYFYKNDNKWYFYKKIAKFVLNGTEDNPALNTNQTNTTRVYYNYDLLDYNAINGVGISNRLIFNNNWSLDEEGFFFNSNAKNLIMRINKSTIGTTVNELNTWLSNNNIEIYYVMTTEIITEITDTTLISQLEALSKALSTQGTTTITQTNADAGFTITTSAILDMNSLLNN